MEHNINYGGDIINREKRDNIQACVVWAHDQNAKFWTYHTGLKDCDLKSSNTEKIEAQNHISGSSACHDIVDFTEESEQNLTKLVSMCHTLLEVQYFPS